MKRTAFTIIELLTVIAIIAILAAITFPIIGKVKDNAYRSSDMTNMNSIRSALLLYREDNGGFPPAILGYVQQYQFPPLAGQTIPAGSIKSYLYPRRLNSLDAFKPAHDKSLPGDTTTAVWPNQDPAPVGSRPLLDLNGDGTIDSTDDYDCARQAFGPADGNVQRADSIPGDAVFYPISGYDVAPVPTSGGGTRYEVHYALFWTKWGLNNGGVFSSCGASPGSVHDDPRQLGYDSPPEDTVLTWNSFYRDNVGAVPNRGKSEIVLYLGGNAKTYDSRDVSEQSWRLKP